MRFNFDRATLSGADESGTYVVAVEGDRYGTIFDIRFNGHTALKVWARRSVRPAHVGDRHLNTDGEISSVLAWVVDNRAGTGLPLLTLKEKVGDHTLEEVLAPFLRAYEAVLEPEWKPAALPLKLECRGNQRYMMEVCYGP